MSRRGTSLQITNRFESITVEPFDDGWGEPLAPPPVPTRFYDDNSRTILSHNDSPDIPYNYSLNPYRGCEHGCVYCYARPTHEYLGFNAAEDFESKIMVKRRAAEMLEAELRKPSWQPQHINLSGNTDCYQPAEGRLKLTRACLEVLAKYRNPVSIVTKNFLVTRDRDILGAMAQLDLAAVIVTITSLDPELTRTMEPRTSTPERRLAAIEILAKAGVRVGVLIAPVIPALNDREIPAIVEAAAERGATFGSMQLLRLPLAVKPIFVDWLERERPLAKERVIAHIKDVRDGKMNNSAFGARMRGAGPQAEAIETMFRVAAKRAGLNQDTWDLSTAHFRRNESQFDLFAQ